MTDDNDVYFIILFCILILYIQRRSFEANRKRKKDSFLPYSTRWTRHSIFRRSSSSWSAECNRRVIRNVVDAFANNSRIATRTEKPEVRRVDSLDSDDEAGIGGTLKKEQELLSRTTRQGEPEFTSLCPNLLLHSPFDCWPFVKQRTRYSRNEIIFPITRHRVID